MSADVHPRGEAVEHGLEAAFELAGQGDRLTDAIVGYGSPAATAAKVREHTAAGADHVTLMITADDFTAGLEQLEELAPALAEIS